MKKALVFYGGWEGHEPTQVANIFKTLLEARQFDVTLSDNLEILENEEFVNSLHVIVPVWTMGKMTDEQAKVISEAVANGTGLIGCHGGMCDAFRENVLWQFITGGNWVSHPGGDGVEYTVEFNNTSSPLVEGMNNFKVKSEHYYLHIDPAVEVLATTRFPNVNWYHSTNKAVDMPVVWTKRWGYGRVYYTSLGHKAEILEMPEVNELINRGLDWVIEGKDLAIKNNWSAENLSSDKPMY